MATPQFLREPAPSFQIHLNLAYPFFYRNIQCGESSGSDNTINSQSMPLLKSAHCLV